MPALGMQQDTGTLLAWLKSEGDPVSKGDPIMEIETDKTVVQIEAPVSGIFGGISAQGGDVVPVGQVVAWILEPGEPAPKLEESGHIGHVPGLPGSGDLAPAHGVKEQGLVKASGQPSGNGGPLGDSQPSLKVGGARLLPASPKARRLARERGFDLAKAAGSGPDGALLVADVPAAGLLATEPPLTDLSGAETKTLEPSRTWQVMVDRLTTSWTRTPQFYLVREVNASRFMAWKESAEQKTGTRLTYSDLLVRLVAASLVHHPRLNASWHEGEIRLHDKINVGLAVAVEDGLVVPVIQRANELTLDQIADCRVQMVGRAQAGKLTPGDISGGTFTISNLGMYGVDMFNAVVNPPQAAILAVGRIAERVIAVGGQPAVRSVMVLSLTCDHRSVDGARAAEFLQTLVRYVEEPMLLLE